MIPNVGCFRILSGQTFSTLLNQYMKRSQHMVDLTKCIMENTSTRYNSLFRMVYFTNVASPLSYRRPCYCPKRPTFGIRWYLTRVQMHLYSVCINFGMNSFCSNLFFGFRKRRHNNSILPSVPAVHLTVERILQTVSRLNGSKWRHPPHHFHQFHAHPFFLCLPPSPKSREH